MEHENPMLEAAAALARCSAMHAAEDAAFHEIKYRMATNSLAPGVSDRNAADKSCSKSSRLNSASKLRQNMTELPVAQDEKESQKLRRILADRESARQSVRRRQAMYQELTRKAVDLSEENENLKKMANAKKAEPRETKEEARSEEPTSATSSSSPVFLYHPSLVPFLWPCTTPSNFIPLQYLSHSYITSLSELSWDTSSSDVGVSGPGNRLFVLHLPLALPYPIYGTFSDTKMRHNEPPSPHQCNVFEPSSSNAVMLEKLSCIKPSEDNICYAASVTGEAEAVICSQKKAENVFTAIRARRRRKEVMMLKNVQTRTHAADSW